MIKLLRAELDRLRWRRFTLMTPIAVLLVLTIFQLQVNEEVSPPSAGEVAAIEAQYQRDLAEWEEHHVEWEQECVDSGVPREQCAGRRPAGRTTAWSRPRSPKWLPSSCSWRST